MELTYDDIREKLKSMGFNCGSETGNGDLLQIEIQKYSPAGQDCNFTLQCEKGNPASAVSALKEIYENYDVDEETSLWIGDDGHGKNGAPYHIKDIVKDMEAVEADLESCAKNLEMFVKNFEIEYTKDDVKEKFAERLYGIYGSEPIEEKHSINLCKQVVESIINENEGSPKQKKAVLHSYLLDIGIKDENPVTYTKILNKIQLEHNHKLLQEKMINQCARGTFNSVTPGMNEIDTKIHRFFDSLFNNSETNPVDYGNFCLCAGYDNSSKRGQQWWKEAVDHAVNSGGELWNDDFERANMLGKADLLKNIYLNNSLVMSCYGEYQKYMKEYGSVSDIVSFNDFKYDIFVNPKDMTEYLQGNNQLRKQYARSIDVSVDKAETQNFYSFANKKYGELMYKYLSDLGVLDDKARDKKIEQYQKRKDSGRSL